MEIDIGGLALFAVTGIFACLFVIILLVGKIDQLEKEVETVKVILSRHDIMAVATV